MIIPEVIHTEVLHEGYFKLIKEHLRVPNRDEYDYYTLIAPPVAVMVLATTEDGKYILNWEYRHPVRKTLLSTPGGTQHENEDPLVCAERELLEETGYRAENFQVRGEAYPFPGICNQKVFYISATNAKWSQKPQHDRAEIIETEFLSLEKLRQTIQKKVPLDGLLLTTLFFCGVHI